MLKNEEYYKNILIDNFNKEKSKVIEELYISRSRADIIHIADKITLYEIKSEVDTLFRLQKQLKDYYKAFSNVCVFSCESKVKSLNKILEKTKTGISILNKENEIEVVKKTESETSFLEHETIFKVLRRSERDNIIQSFFGFLPTTTPVFYFDFCFELFEEIPLEEVHSMFLNQMRNRSCRQKNINKQCIFAPTQNKEEKWQNQN